MDVAGLSEKAIMEEKELFKLIASRRGKLSVLTRKRNEINALIEAGENKETVAKHTETFNNVLAEFMELQVSVQSLLNEDKKEADHVDWYEPKLILFREFLNGIELWMKEKDTSDEMCEGAVGPHDSVSQASDKSFKKSSHKSSKVSSKSNISASVALLQAEAERAALKAKARTLEQKHILDIEEVQLKVKKEKLALEAEMAAADAKVDVFLNSESFLERISLKDGLKSDVSSTHTEYIIPARTPKPQSNQVKSSKQHTSTSVTKITHQSSDDNTAYADIMKRQNEITALLVKQQQTSLLPTRTIPVFDGDPLQFRSFIKHKNKVENKTDNAQDRLYYLEQFTVGQPRNLVRSCMHMDPVRGYKEAKQQLEWNFGNAIKIASAFMEKALNWTALKAEDGLALRAYALFLRGCYNTMQEVDFVEELENSANMRTIASKLPFKLRDKWRTIACSIPDRCKRKVKFKDLLEFIENQTRTLLDPVFGDIQSQTEKRGIPKVTTVKQGFKSTSKSSSFATSVASVMEQVNVKLKPDYHTLNTVKRQCMFCAKDHTLETCDVFKDKPNKDKMEFIKAKGLCFGCLGQGHMSKSCQKRKCCQICRQQHPTILHIETKNVQRECQTTKGLTKESSISSALVSLNDDDEYTGAGVKDCVLSIVPVNVKMNKGSKIVQTYAFLDPGSSATFCTEELMTQLNATGRKMNILLKTMGQEKLVSSYRVSGLEVAALRGNEFLKLPDVYTQDSIPVTKDNIPSEKDIRKWPYLKEVDLTAINASIGLLIGVNVPKALEPWRIINSQGSGPYAVKTLLGWVINGPISYGIADGKSDAPKVQVNRVSIENLEELLIQQYNQDFIEQQYNEKREMSVEDRQFMEIISETAELKNGHYYLKLPFREANVKVPNNKKIAFQRAQHLIRRFKNDTTFFTEYKEFMNDVIAKEYAEMVPNDQLETEQGKVWYLPHHGVRHPRKKTLRVVYDCAATFGGTSLNKELLQGPDLTNNLLGVLLRFRQGPIALLTDIEGMFHQVRVAREDVDFQRFLWWPDGDVTKDLKEYRMVVHIFGAVSSPSCATFALLKTADDNQSDYGEDVINTIKLNFYVDDCLKSVNTVDQAISLYHQLTEVCSKGGFRLNKWISNERSVLSAIPQKDRAKGVKTLDLSKDQLPMERALGVQWDVEKDVFTFSTVLKQHPVTRRGILSIVCSIYDPLGFLSPIILAAKQILQDLCKLKLQWDEKVPLDTAVKWQRWLNELIPLHAFNVDRCFTSKDFGNITSAQLHNFADASEVGYGAVSYLRLLNNKEEVSVAFAIGKAKVAPLKQTTIPRLELAAAVLAVRLDRMLKTELQLHINESFFWSDSTTVLKYIANTTKRFKTYVANRISIIHSYSKPSQWKYINSKLNPADAASRGMKTEEFLRTKVWINGPDFLLKPSSHWPEAKKDVNLSLDNDPEVREKICVCATMTNEKESPTGRFLNYYSDWTRLKRAVAWMHKFMEFLKWQVKEKKMQSRPSKERKCKQKAKSKIPGNLSLVLNLEDLNAAERVIVSFVQREDFKEEISALKWGTLYRHSHLYKLDPKIDDGMLRVGGRLSKLALPEEVKHPVILPKSSHVSKLILQHIHEKIGHRGRNHMLSTLRRQYWIPQANSASRKIIKECVICQRKSQKPGEQKMADLPADRISMDHPPFTYVGMDYFGPIETKRGRGTVKRYGVIFTCLTCRAVHIEMAHSLDTDSCINAIRRFLCRRGQVKEIRSDNGTNFVSANRELKNALKVLDHSKIQNSLTENGIKWTFNPPYGAHHGGVWECLVQQVKKVLYSVVKQQMLDDETLHTVLCEIEAILNDRPITPSSDDPEDLEALTPNHIILLKAKPILPSGLFSKEDLYTRRRWRQVQYLADLFWKRWVKEYLPMLQQRQKWHRPRRNFSIGDLVLVVDETAPRNSWPMGRIIETMTDSKGFVRRVRLRTQVGQLERPINKLCLLMHASD